MGVLQADSFAGAEVFCKIAYGRGKKMLYFPLQSQKVFDICSTAGLGEWLSLAWRWV